MPPTPSRGVPAADTPLPEWVSQYVAALVDNHTSLIVSVARASNRALGYRPKQELRYKTDNRAVLDLLERYCAAQDISPRITEQSGTTYPRYTFELSARSDLVAFLAPLRPYLQLQEYAVGLLVETLIPGLEAGAHTDPEAFLAWTRYLDVFRKASGRANRSKYDYDYFREELAVDPDQLTPSAFEWASHELPADGEGGGGGNGDGVSEDEGRVSDGEGEGESKSKSKSDGHATNEVARSAAGVAARPDEGGDVFDIHQDQPPDWLPPYIAALVDAHFNFVIGIGEDANRAVGYKINHRLEYKAEGEAICNLLEAYLSSLGITPRIRKRSDTVYDHYTLTLSKRDAIRTLLEAVRPYLVAREDAVRILVETIIPALNAGAHGNQELFVALVGDIERFRDAAGMANRAEYTQADFEQAWDLDT